MTTVPILETFGQLLPSTRRLSPMARAISSGIADGRRARWVGFVSFRPQLVVDKTLDRTITKYL